MECEQKEYSSQNKKAELKFFFFFFFFLQEQDHSTFKGNGVVRNREMGLI